MDHFKTETTLFIWFHEKSLFRLSRQHISVWVDGRAVWGGRPKGPKAETDKTKIRINFNIFPYENEEILIFPDMQPYSYLHENQ